MTMSMVLNHEALRPYYRGAMQAGVRYSRYFREPGQFQYYCSFTTTDHCGGHNCSCIVFIHGYGLKFQFFFLRIYFCMSVYTNKLCRPLPVSREVAVQARGTISSFPQGFNFHLHKILHNSHNHPCLIILSCHHLFLYPHHQ